MRDAGDVVTEQRMIYGAEFEERLPSPPPPRSLADSDGVTQTLLFQASAVTALR